MTFDLHQLDHLEFDENNELIHEYVQEAIQAFGILPKARPTAKSIPTLAAGSGHSLTLATATKDSLCRK